nr:hypothetical protein [Tanacetum cinerariifolium]
MTTLALLACKGSSIKRLDETSDNLKKFITEIENLKDLKVKIISSQNNIDDKGYWDNGCSRHITGNISYLSDFEPFDRGYVSFGQGGCKITGKGTIKTGKLEFENAYFVKDLKYNLFSVSQICDIKNSVLFTDSEFIDYSRPMPTIKSTLEEDQNKNSSTSEDVASPILPKPFVKFVKPKDTQSEKNKKETPKKSQVKYAKQYRHSNKKPNVKGNQRNWNNLKYYQLGPEFVWKKKACFNCGDFSHLANECRKRVQRETTRKFPTASRKFTTCSTKIHTADMGRKGKAVKPSACWIWKPSQNLSNKGPINNSVSVMFKKFTYIDTQGRLKSESGCSRHMTGNISYLSDFEPFCGGYVSFSQGGCKITGKETIKTGKLEFENVYFEKDLKYNLFSVSQICENKNSVMFTDSECIVLGRDFKLLDDANILFRTPRQHNMYSIHLNNIVPHKDLTCLVAKASAVECILWHRRLGYLNVKTMNKLVRHNLVRGLPNKSFDNDHTCTACLTKDETSDNLKKFITKIENLKDLKVKIISNAWTPQQNGIAKRRNRTLIEAARTMLVDAKLPVTFWAEAVNTACYVQNRVSVNKSQNKTPYELFNGRTPAIGFLKPVGCHVIILNTLDNLGKFEAQGDE